MALIAACGFGYAVAVNWGQLAPGAFLPLVMAGLLVIWRLLALARPGARDAIAGELIWVPLVLLLAALAWNAHEDRLLWHTDGLSPSGRSAQLAIAVLVLGYLPSALGVREPGWLAPARFAGVALLVGFVGVDTLARTPRPLIDVWDLQQRAADLLMHGRNPYSELRVRDTYWGRGLPFAYPPTIIYIGVLGKALFGDVRASNLFLILVTGVGLAAIARRSPVRLPAIGAEAPALVLWLQPRLFFVLEQAWVDVIPLAFLTGGLALFLGRHRRTGVVLLAVALSSKQTMFWFLPLIALCLDFREDDWRALLATLMILIGPFMLWNFGALWAANFSLHEALEPRPDALVFMAWYFAKYHVWHSTAWLAFATGLATLALVAGRLRRSLPAFGLAATAIYFLFFFFEKQAFANYYYFVAGLACLAASTALHGKPVAAAAVSTPPSSDLQHASAADAVVLERA